MNIDQKKNDNKMKKISIICLLLSVSIGSLYSQNQTIKGRVITEDFEPIPMAFIMINDTVEVGKTDLEGFFQIVTPISVGKILFGFIGMEPASIKLVDKCNEVEVVMMLRSTYDFMTLKKVDRLRMKEFKKLPDLHKEAFEKGLFKTDKACYSQEFIPHFKKKK